MVADDDDEMGSQDPELIQSSKLFAPKSLVLVSRLEYFDTFRVSGGREVVSEIKTLKSCVIRQYYV